MFIFIIIPPQWESMCHISPGTRRHGDSRNSLNGTGDMEHTRACERSGENFRSPLTWVFAPPAPPLKVTPDRSAHFRSPLTYNFIPLRVKSLHARSNLKFLCMTNTLPFQPKPYAWDTLPAWRTWSGFVAWLLRKKSASLLSVVGPRLRCGWTAPDTRVFRRQCGCSNLLT